VNLVWGMGITIVEATRLTTPVSVADTPFHFPFARPNSRSRQQPLNASVGRSDARGRLCLS
jgi:hypothetical protein